MNVKIGKTEAILLILIVMINKILLNIPKEIIIPPNISISYLFFLLV